MTSNPTPNERGTHLESSQFGTAGKGGALKVYYPADNLEMSRRIIKNALTLHFEAKQEFERRNG